MSNPSADQPFNSSDSSLQINQEIEGDRNQTIGQVLGGVVVYGQVIYNYSAVEPDSSTAQHKDAGIGPNPYRGLLAFHETDGDRFFGRDSQIDELWEKLRRLHEDESATRLLTIYGPSGSGKSSLARAGLIPALAKRPLPGRDRARVAVLVPGSHPLEALATVVARIATNDPAPAAKTREFSEELTNINSTGKYDGLRRIADVLPDIEISPLIVLVDQLEEVYTLCTKEYERDAFIGNLLYAASDRSNRVSVIVTLRSDFLGETQKHLQLNQLIAEQGVFVSAMSADGLRDAIRKPAKIAGHAIDESTVSLLVEQTEGREGALPLLQFTLTQIWEGLGKKREPAQTLMDIGGVGGALPKIAQEIYEDKLSPIQQRMARRVFLGLVQLGEDSQDSRRRLSTDSLVYGKGDLSNIQKVIDLFAKPDVRIITCSWNNLDVRTAELTHEILIQEWQLLRDWIKDNRENLRQIRHLELEAQAWNEHGRSKDDLLGFNKLERVKSFSVICEEDLPFLVQEYVQESSKYNEELKIKNQVRKRMVIFISSLISVTALSAIIYFISSYIFSKNQKELELTQRMSTGEHILVSSTSPAYKKAGSLSFATSLKDPKKENEYLKSAIDQFTSSLQGIPDDPETRIYLNNAKILYTHVEHYTVAVTALFS